MTLGPGIVEGLRGGRATAVSAIHLWLAALVLAGIAGAPFAGAVHEVLDRHPGAERLAGDGGVAVVEEISRTTGDLAGLHAPALPLLVAIAIPLSIFLLGGTYFLAAGGGDRPVRAFWAAGASRFLPFLGIAAAAALYGTLVAAACGGAIALARLAFSEPSGEGVYVVGVAVTTLVVAAGTLHLRTVLGFALACREVATEPRIWRPFREGLSIAWRRAPSAHAVGLAYALAQGVAALAGGFLADRLGWGGLVSAVAAQLGWLAFAWLRAGEVRSRVALAAAWTPKPPAAAPAPETGVEDAIAIGACVGEPSVEPLLPDRLGEGTDLVEEQR